MGSSLQFDVIAALVRAHLGQSPEREAVRPIATGKFNESYEIALDTGPVVLRVAPPDSTVFCFYERRMMRQEPQIHAMLSARTGVPVPEILAADFSRNLLDRDFLIMRRLIGMPLTECRGMAVSEYAAVLRQIGSYLREVHALQGTQYGYLGEHRPMRPAATWPEAFGRMWDLLVADIVAVDGYTEEEASFVRTLYAEAGAQFQDSGRAACFLHMDIWHQNILVDERGKVSGILDWDRALWGDPEIEFAVLEYCGISKRPFWQGYGAERPRDAAAQVRGLFFLLYEIQKYIVIRKGRNGRPEEAARYKRQALQLARNIARLNAG